MKIRDGLVSVNPYDFVDGVVFSDVGGATASGTEGTF
jgi:hypothetical protein